MCVICVMGRGAMTQVTHMMQPGAGCLSPRRIRPVPAKRPAGEFTVLRRDDGRAPRPASVTLHIPLRPE